MENKPTKPFPTAAETLEHPAYPGTIWNLEPHQEGLFPAAKDRGGPVNISWEIHGDGPTKIVLLMGLAGVKASWQRQTKHFGHDQSSKYSVLIIDNRGIGASDKPFSRYSTTTMALDVMELLDHVGWTSPRQIHLAGISLGGMISQELACMIPERLASLILLCTAAAVENTKAWYVGVGERVSMIIPKTMERAIEDTAKQVFVEEWLAAEDDAELPSPKTTPKCGPAPTDDGEYVRFDCNFQRFQAQELVKRRDPSCFGTKGVLLQLGAAGFHRKSAIQLKDMADKVGRERITIMHGTADNMIDVKLGQKLIRMVDPGKSIIVPGMGHAPVQERFKWFNTVLEERIAECEPLGG